MNRGKVLITDDIHPVLAEKLSAHGYQCETHSSIAHEEILNRIAEFDGIVINTGTTIDRPVIDRGKKLKFIARAGSGMEIIDVAYAQSKKIICLNSPEGNRDAVAEQVIGMMLGLLHHFPRADRQLRNHQWTREYNRGTEMMGKTIGIIGFGNTGSSVAKKLKGFDVKILAYDKYKHGFGSEDVEEVDLNEIFESADIVTFHIPHNPETHFMINESFIDSFTKPIMLINCARGKILKTDDLVDALKRKKIIAAALDVFENENKTEMESGSVEWYEELIAMDNVILTPHIAGWSHESKRRVAEILADKIISFSP